jgi:hypothetical protein
MFQTPENEKKARTGRAFLMLLEKNCKTIANCCAPGFIQ